MKRLALTAAILGLTAACAPAGNSGQANNNAIDPNRTVVATIGGTPLYADMIDLYKAERFKGVETLNEEQNQQIMDDLAQLVSLANKATADGLHKESDIAARLQIQEMSFLAQQVVARHVEANPIDDAAIQAAYDAGTFGTEYKARHILVKEETEAANLIKLLDGGADFEELAKEHSTGPSGPKGGDLGWFPAAQMVKPFGDALPGIPAGTYGKTAVQTQFGWHVILVEETRKPPMEQVQGQISQQLSGEVVKDFLAQIKSNVEVITK